jgi:hypothetical protein
VALDAVIIPIVLGELFLVMPLFALSPSPVYGRLVALEDCLFRERRLHRHKMGSSTRRTRRQGEVSSHRELLRRFKSIENNEIVGKLIRGRNHLRDFHSPRWGSIGRSCDSGHMYVVFRMATDK